METIDVYGVDKDGIQVFIGKAPIPVEMKIKDIARSYFGHDEDDTDCCIGALEELLSFIREQQSKRELELLAALENAVSVAKTAHECWDNDQDMKVGKYLIALSGSLPGYDKRTDEIHAAIASVKEKK